MSLHEKYKSLLEKCEINTPLRLAHFMAQIEHESGLKPISENLNYSVKGLSTTFAKYFKEDLKLPCSKEQREDYNKDLRRKGSDYAHKPINIANIVYANRMGNGNEQSGDGWKFRGRGFIQITGKENYNRLCNDVGLNCVANPDLLLEEANAMISALWFWNKNDCNRHADLDDILSLTRKINGGLNGIEHRKKSLKKWKS